LKFFRYSLYIFVCVFLSSCASKPVPIPGDRTVKINNLYNEYYNIAEIYYSLEKYDKAEVYYKIAMENKNLHWACKYKIAKTYACQSKWKEAASIYQEILKRDSNNYSVKASLAYLYSMQNDNKKSLEIYEELCEIQPDNQEYLENYIAVLIYSKNLELANEKLLILKEKFPDSVNYTKLNSSFEELYKELNPSSQEKKSEDEKSQEEGSVNN